MSTPPTAATFAGSDAPSVDRSGTHLMIVHERFAPDLISGRKSVESRLGRDRRAPFGRVNPGDLVYLKCSGGPVFAAATVERVDEFEDLTPGEIENLRSTYEDRVLGGDAYWASKSDAKFATLVWLGSVRPVRDESAIPSELLKPSRNAWRTLESSSSGTARRAA